MAFPEAPPPHVNKPSVPQVSKAWRHTALLLLMIVIGLIIAFVAVANPFDAGTVATPTPKVVVPSPTPSPSTTRPPYQFPSVTESQIPGSQQCPDAGSVGAGDSDAKTEVVQIKDDSKADIRLLGPNRRVVIAEGATMSGSITICGDGGTVLIIGRQTGPVLMQGSGVKIVVQDAGAEKLPPAYSTTNGRVFKCTTDKKERTTPQCSDYLPRPGAKPNG